MKRKTNVEKLQEIIGGECDCFGDNTASWLRVEDDKFSIDFIFDGKGQKFEDIKIAQKIWQVVDEKVIIKLAAKNIKG